MVGSERKIKNTEDVFVKTSNKAVLTVGFGLFILLFGVGGLWSMYAHLSGAVIAQGQVAILGKPKTIQHLDGGIISEIRVADGDRVSKGDVLVRLDGSLLKANLNIYQNRLRESLAKQARLITERDDIDVITWRDDDLKNLGIEDKPAIKQGQEKLFLAREETRVGQISQLQEKITQFKYQIKGTKGLQKSKKKQLDFLEEELESIRFLKDKGLVSKSRLMNLERQKESLIGQNAEHSAELARIREAISETEIQILQVNREFRQAVLMELRKVEQDINDITQQFRATQEQLDRIEVKAPVSGIIHELSIFTIGGVIGPGKPIMQIIPQDQTFEIEANIAPNFIDELYPNQPTTLRFSAFNQRTTPELNGVVKTISPNVVLDEKTGLSFYKVRITLSKEELKRLKGQSLVSGMPVEVFVTTQERTPLNYLLKPLSDQIKHAFREE